MRAAPGALGTVGSVLGEVFNMKTKLHQPGDQEKGLGFCNTAGSWDSECEPNAAVFKLSSRELL